MAGRWQGYKLQLLTPPDGPDILDTSPSDFGFIPPLTTVALPADAAA